MRSSRAQSRNPAEVTLKLRDRIPRLTLGMMDLLNDFERGALIVAGGGAGE